MPEVILQLIKMFIHLHNQTIVSLQLYCMKYYL